ncbi:MAG: toll/interleukin-1 receptor domain-containing protein, partial [Nitratireductor sp.]
MAIEIDDIDNETKLEAYLSMQPARLSKTIAMRSALRALPFLQSAYSSGYEKADELTSATSRALFISWVACKYPTHDMKIVANAAAYAAAEAAEAAAAAAAAAKSAVYAAADAAYASHAANADAAYAAYAVNAANAATRGVIWQSVRNDLIIYKNTPSGKDGIKELLNELLWVSGTPKNIVKIWHELKSDLLKQNADWEVWLGWYEHILMSEGLQKGGIALLGEAALVDLAQKPNEFWEREPKEVNADIKAMLPEPIQSDEAINADEQYDFFLSYSTKDEERAKEICGIVEALGCSVFTQFKDFKDGNNIIQMMQKGLEKSSRVIALYSPDYFESEYCMAEWNAAFSADPSGTKRKLLPLLIKQTALPALARDIVYRSLIGKNLTEQKQIISDAITDLPSSSTRKNLASFTSPEPFLNDALQLDVRPNTIYDKPNVDEDLVELPIRQLSLIRGLKKSLSNNGGNIVPN